MTERMKVGKAKIVLLMRVARPAVEIEEWFQDWIVFLTRVGIKLK